jgi:hypothetical protein
MNMHHRGIQVKRHFNTDHQAAMVEFAANVNSTIAGGRAGWAPTAWAGGP